MPNPRSRQLVLAAAVAALAISLSGCSADAKPSPPPAPASSDAAPIFASDEEALEAAVTAYEAYAAASDAIAADGGAEPERIDEFVTQDFSAAANKEFDALREAKGHIEGKVSYDTVSLIERNERNQSANVSIYFCRDVSSVRAVAADGTDVTPSDRPDRVPSQANFVSSDAAPSILLVDGISQWSGKDFC